MEKKNHVMLVCKKTTIFSYMVTGFKKTTVMYQYLQKNSSSILLNPHLDQCYAVTEQQLLKLHQDLWLKEPLNKALRTEYINMKISAAPWWEKILMQTVGQLFNVSNCPNSTWKWKNTLCSKPEIAWCSFTVFKLLKHLVIFVFRPVTHTGVTNVHRWKQAKPLSTKGIILQKRLLQSFVLGLQILKAFFWIT